MNEEAKDNIIQETDEDIESYLKKASLTVGIISSILGITSIIFVVFSLANWSGIAFLLGFFGALLGAVGVKAQKYAGFATAGFACSCVGIALGFCGWLACSAVPMMYGI